MTKEVSEGSGNVFADLGLSNPAERQAKARLALHIEYLIEQASWTQAEAAERMGVSQPDVSNIVNGRLKGFTLDRLFQCLDALGQEIEIGIKPKQSTNGSERLPVPYK